MPYTLAIDQGTTSSRAIIFDDGLQPVAVSQSEFTQHFPRSGWVEHEAEEIWSVTLACCQAAMDQAGLTAADIAAIGITNQRETIVLWDAETGSPILNAIVWQDRRTAAFCQTLKTVGLEPDIQERTGLLLDPYFSATKIRWVLDNVDGARARAEVGKLRLGTIDTWLIWKLTNGASHVTDATNASRTMLYNINVGCWDEDLLNIFDIPRSILPEVKDCGANFGCTGALGGQVTIRGVLGDQHAATVGQACFEPGMVKSTYGTGGFAVMNTGADKITSQNRLLTTIAYQFDGTVTYALEGSIFIAGAAVQWLRDGLGIIPNAKETERLAKSATDDSAVVLVPAFTGLGAPYWSADSRGAVFGLTRDSGPADFARATLESIGFQTRDLIEAMTADAGPLNAVLRVDGGLVENGFAMQFLSNILGAPVDRPKMAETTALGAAWVAGREAGIYPDLKTFANSWAIEQQFTPEMPQTERDQKYARWQKAVSATLTFTDP